MQLNLIHVTDGWMDRVNYQTGVKRADAINRQTNVLMEQSKQAGKMLKVRDRERTSQQTLFTFFFYKEQTN